MSANEHPDTVFECIRGGAEDYLLKPLTKKEVQYIWQHVWRRKHQPAIRVPPQPAQGQVSACMLHARTHHACSICGMSTHANEFVVPVAGHSV